jgi:hypothetical protein
LIVSLSLPDGRQACRRRVNLQNRLILKRWFQQKMNKEITLNGVTPNAGPMKFIKAVVYAPTKKKKIEE